MSLANSARKNDHTCKHTFNIFKAVVVFACRNVVVLLPLILIWAHL